MDKNVPESSREHAASAQTDLQLSAGVRKQRTDDIVTSQVLEYYSKYSQSKQLPKYFCGDTAPFTRPPLIGQDHSNLNKDTTADDSTNDVHRVPSPASSVNSKSKLEWDNGADIGYENADSVAQSKQKSLSLPALTSLEKIELQKNRLRLSPEGVPTDRGVKIAFVQSAPVEDGDDDDCSQEGTDKEENSDDDDDKETPRVDANEFLKMLKKAVGYPTAESTPNPAPSNPTQSRSKSAKTRDKKLKSLLANPSSSCENLSRNAAKLDIKKSRSNDELTMNRSFKEKLSRLEVSKSVYVECSAAIELKNNPSKSIQTSLKRQSTVAIQTEFAYVQSPPTSATAGKSPRRSEKQSVIYVQHLSDDNAGGTSSASTQTQESAGPPSKCNSFEYLYGDLYDDAQKQVVPPLDLPHSSPSEDYSAGDNVVAKKGSNTISMTSSSNLTSSTSNTPSLQTTSDCAVSALLEMQLSKNLKTDVEKSLELMQKLIQSKKYDSTTKQHFIKKLVKKILNSNYDDDTSSEAGTVPVHLQQKACSSSTVEDMLQKSLHNNKPWIPPAMESFKQRVPPPIRKPPRKFEVKTFCSEIVAPESNSDAMVPTLTKSKTEIVDKMKVGDVSYIPTKIIYERKLKNSKFTLTNNFIGTEYPNKQYSSTSPEYSTSNELYDLPKKFSLPPKRRMDSGETTSAATDECIEKQEQIVKNWKDCKTKSEKMFETKKFGQSEPDQVINYAKKERENQLSWIRNEITHLSKLKNLLENKNSTRHKALVKTLAGMNFDEVFSQPRTTDVYMLHSQKIDGGRRRTSFDSDTDSNSPCSCKCTAGTVGDRREHLVHRKVEDFPCQLPNISGNLKYPRGIRLQGVTVEVEASISGNSNETCKICKCNPCKASKSSKHNRCNSLTTECVSKQIQIVPSVQSTATEIRPKCLCQQTQSEIENEDEGRRRVASHVSKDFEMQYEFRPVEPPKSSKDSSTDAPLATASIERGVQLKDYVIREESGTDPAPNAQFTQKGIQSDTCPSKDCKSQTDSGSRRNSRESGTDPDPVKQKRKKSQLDTHVNSHEYIPSLPDSATSQKSSSVSKPLDTRTQSYEIPPAPIVCSKPSTSRESENDSREILEFNIQTTEQAISCCGNCKTQCIPVRYSMQTQIHEIPPNNTNSRRSSADAKTGTESSKQVKSCACNCDFPTESSKQVKSCACNCDLPDTNSSKSTSRSKSRSKSKDSSDRSEKLQSCTCNCNAQGGDSSRAPSGRKHSKDFDVQHQPATRNIQMQCDCVSKGCKAAQTQDDVPPKEPEELKEGVHSKLHHDDGKKSKIKVKNKATKTDFKDTKDSQTETANGVTDSKRTTSTSTSKYSTASESSHEQTYNLQDVISLLCKCCQKPVEETAASKKKPPVLRIVRDRDSEDNEPENFILCHPCYECYETGNTDYNYNLPTHRCNCYMNRCVTCRGPAKFWASSNVMYCRRCMCARKGKKSVAYMLTFEEGGNKEQDESDSDVKVPRELEEVKIKIPFRPSKKRTKNIENEKRASRNRRLSSSMDDYDSEESKENRKKSPCSSDGKRNKCNVKKKTPTLQEALMQNHPNFIDAAEGRRRCMIELAIMREQRCNKYKQLLAATNGKLPKDTMEQYKNPIKHRLFSTKTMKEMTKRKYKKLPEVQKRLLDHREKQQRKANRMLADIYNKKLQRKALRGNINLSPSVNLLDSL